MQQNYLVGTGVAPLFHIQASCPREAVETLKEMIRARKQQVRWHPLIGMSLVKALEENRLNFIVFDTGRTEVLAGELNGEYLEPATRALADALRHFVPQTLYVKLPFVCNDCGCR